MSNIKYQLVLARHGHTEWNLTNRFTGWSDVSLSKIGLEEAKQIGLRLNALDYSFDEVHLSELKRTRQTLESILTQFKHPTIPVYTSWRLNERHYGDLQGRNKQEIFELWGKEKSYQWWRGYFNAPPPLKEDDPRHPRYDLKYKEIDPKLLPASESLELCTQRLKPYWKNVLVPKIQSGRRILIISHGNTLRSLRMLVENISSKNIEKVEIAFDTPFIYHFDKQMNLSDIEWLEESVQYS